MNILAARGSSLLLRNEQQDVLFSENLGLTRKKLSLSFPMTSISQMCVTHDSIAIVSNKELYVTTNGGRSEWIELHTFFPSTDHYKDKISWCDSLLLVVTPYPALQHRFHRLSDRVDETPFDKSISGTFQTRDYTVFNYNGRISLSRQRTDIDGLYSIQFLEMAAAQLDDIVLVLTPRGTQHVTRDKGITWTTEQILPRCNVDSLRSFEHGDSLYVYLGAQMGWWSSDTALREWSRVTYTTLPYQSAYANVHDTLFVWASDIGLLRYPSIDQSLRPTLVDHNVRTPVTAFTTETGAIITVYTSQILRSDDGGHTYTEQLRANNLIRAGYSEGICWVAGDSLYISHDDGESWSSLHHNISGATLQSVSYHNGSALFVTDSGVFLRMPDSDIRTIELPTSTLPKSYAFFDEIPYIATQTTLFRYRDGRWFTVVDDAQDVHPGTLQATDEYYYGTDTASHPIRWRPGRSPEVLSRSHRVVAPTIACTGPFVVFTSRQSGTFVYSRSGTTTVDTPPSTIRHDNTILHAHTTVDLSPYRTIFSNVPTVTMYNISGRIIHSQNDSWTVQTTHIPGGFYLLMLSDGEINTSMMIYLSSN